MGNFILNVNSAVGYMKNKKNPNGGVLARIWPGPSHLNKHVCRKKEGYLGNGQLYTKCEYRSRIEKK